MDDVSKQINEQGKVHTELPDVPDPVTEEQIKAMATKIEKAKVEKKTTKKVSKNTSKKKEPLEDLEVADGKEKEEDVSEAPEIGDLEYADGKERDDVDLIEEEEKIYGIHQLSPFGTADTRVFKRKLENMDLGQKKTLSQRVGGRSYANDASMDQELNKLFNMWCSRNKVFQTNASKKAEKGARSEAFEGSESVNALEEKLKSKTLSDLQATASRLGFNPGFDRNKLITLIKQEYQRQS